MFVTDYSVHTTSLTWDATGAHSIAPVSQFAFQQIRSLSGLCNAAEFDGKSQHLPLSERPIFGDATDQAILRFSEGFGPVSETRQNWKTFYTLAFDSKNKFMVKTFTAANSESPTTSLSPMEASRFHSGDMYVITMFDLILGQH